LIEPIINGEADAVIGSRFLTRGDETPTYRKIGIKMISWTIGAKVKSLLIRSQDTGPIQGGLFNQFNLLRWEWE